MKVEKTAGAVVFRKEKGNLFFLLLRYEEGHWDFPRGHIEKGEKTEHAVRREVKEEAGLKDLKFIDGFKKTIKFMFKWPPKDPKQEWRIKFVAFFLAETKTKEVKLSFEHTDFAWLKYEDAIKKLTHKTAKEVLKSAHEFLKLKIGPRH